MIRQIFRVVFGLSALVLLASASPALADKGGNPHPGSNGRGRHHAPEFDIAAAGAVAAIVAGGGVLLARRRRS
jgi:hypothetical protein